MRLVSSDILEQAEIPASGSDVPYNDGGAWGEGATMDAMSVLGINLAGC